MPAMNELERIADQLQRSYEGTSWHGPSVKEALEGVTPEVAARRIIANAHSIWELVHHIGAWADIVRRRIGGETVDVTNDLNFPPVPDESASAWQQSLGQLERSQRELREFALTISEPRLSEPVMEGGTSVYMQLHGVAQHNVYHAGQIVILKKMS